MRAGFRPTEPPPQRPSPELLFEFHANHRFFRAELLDRGKWGIEAQIIEAPDDLRIGHRFDHREQAVLWAQAMRADMEAWRLRRRSTLDAAEPLTADPGSGRGLRTV